MTHPQRSARYVTPRMAFAAAMALLSTDRQRDWTLANDVMVALANAGNDAAPIVRLDLTAREAAWIEAVKHPSNRQR
jgi:hypothetical protein